MTYKEYKEILAYELYHGKKLSLLKRIRSKYFTLSTSCVYLCRKMWYLYSKGPVSRFIALLYKQKIMRRFGCWIDHKAKVGKGLVMPHPVGIVMGSCTIGDDCTIYQNVSIGEKHIGDGEQRGMYPTIGNNVKIFTSSIILGGISVCDNTYIGANSLVIKTIDEPGTYVGNPVRRIAD